MESVFSYIGNILVLKHFLKQPWQAWLDWLDVVPRSERLPVRTHPWVAGVVPVRARAGGNWLMLLSLSFSLLPLSLKNESFSNSMAILGF